MPFRHISRRFWHAVVCCIGASACTASVLPFNHDFESSEGYVLGALSAGSNWTWSASMSATVISAEAFSGSQAVSLAGDGWFNFNSTGWASGFDGGVTWVDFYLKPVFAEAAALPTDTNEALATMTGFVKVGSSGEVYAVDGDGVGSGDWIASGRMVTLLEDRSVNWLRISYRLDYGSKRWDLFLDGSLVLADLGFVDNSASEFTRFRIRGDEEQSTLLDYVYAGSENPLFADTMGTGISDAWFIAHGLNPALSQRYGDPDRDGVDNLTEFRLGLSPNSPDTDNDGVFDRKELLLGSNPKVAQSWNLASIPFGEGFETDAPGPFVDGTRFWSLQSGENANVAVVSAGGTPEGAHSLAMTGSSIVLERHFSDVTRAPIVWLDFHLKNSPVDEPPQDIPADVAAVFYFAADGQLMVLNGGGNGGGEWRATAASSADWNRLSLRLDYSNQRWAIWLSGVRVANNLGFAHPVPYFSGFSFKHSGTQTAGLDGIQVLHGEPALLDNDGDGLTNAEEIALGTNPELVDSDGDGISDPLELQLGLNPVTAETYIARLENEGSGVYAWRTSFAASEGYAAGSLNGQLGWQSGGAAVNESENATVVAQAGASGIMERYLGAGGLDKVWVTFRARLQAGTLPESSALSGQAASLFGFRGDNTLSVYDSTQAKWIDRTVTATADEWNNYALYLDYRTQRWLLVLNGKLIIHDLPFRDTGLSTITRFRMLQTSSEDGEDAQHALIDDLVVTNAEPVGLDFDEDDLTNDEERTVGTDPFKADTDGDGMPDGWEIAYGLNPLVANALSDVDGDGFTNIVEFKHGTNPNEATTALAGFAHWSEWQALTGATVAALTGDARYPASPDYRALLAGLELPAGRGSNYGTRLRAWLTPTISGDYTFWVAGDDAAELWLGVDETPFRLQRIAYTKAYTGLREWEKYPVTQRSATVSLVAGQSYYIQVLHKQATGGGNVSVAWQPPGGSRVVVPASVLNAFPRFQNDQDEDDLPDDWERANGLLVGSGGLAHSAGGDFDQDGVSNSGEYLLGLRPNMADTDNDGVFDLAELELGTDPLDPDSHFDQGVTAPWQLGVIGGKAFQWAVQSGAKVVLRTNTTPFASSSDAGGMLYQRVTGNFTCDGSIHFPDTARSDMEGGLMVRDSLEKDAAFVSISRISNSGWMVRLRTQRGARVLTSTLEAGSSLDYSSMTVRRVGAMVSLYGQKPGGVSRKLADYPVNFTSSSVLVGYVASSGGAAKPGIAVFAVGTITQPVSSDVLPDDTSLANFDSVKWEGEWDGLSSPVQAELPHIPEIAELTAVGAVLSADVTLPGASGITTSGSWGVEEGAAVARDRRGALSWEINNPRASVYLVEFIVREVNAAKALPSHFPLKLFVDGRHVGTRTVAATATQPASVVWFSPWLPAGVHTVRLVWDGAAEHTFLKIDRLVLHRVDGIDADINNIPDWMDRRLHLFNGIDTNGDSIRSAVSPLPLEGRARWPQLTSLTVSNVSVPVSAGAGYRWFAEVPLVRDTTLPMVFSGENGVVRRELNLRWTPHDAFSGGIFNIRVGSRLLVGAVAGSGETVSVTLNGSVVTLTGGVGELAFPTAGTYRVVGQATGTQGTRSGETIVNVYALPVLPVFAGMVDRERVISRPALAQGVVLEADPRLEWSSVPTNTAQVTWQADEGADRRIVARAGQEGPILAATDAPGSDVYSDTDTYVRIVNTLPDGTHIVETTVILSPVRVDHAVKIEIFVAGVFFEDGSITKTLAPQDFDELGQARVRMLWPANSSTSICHRTHLLYKGAIIGTR